MNNIRDSIVKIARTHQERLQYTLDALKSHMPIQAAQIENLSPDLILLFDGMTTRFSKLQDHLGSKVFNLCLDSRKENYQGLSMIDKLNKLEKIGMIDGATWDKMRELRNHLTHEYPDQPELTAKYLNLTYNLSPQLIELSNKLIGYI